MTEKDLLEGKRLLIVDDEPDILDTLEGLLSRCIVVKASSFAEAEKQLNTGHFDLAVLDIMGVDGYKLLEIAHTRKVPAVMLTAHALSPDHTVRSYKEGADDYIPKDEIVHIETFLNDVLEARMKGKNPWRRWLQRFGDYYDKKFGPDWRDSDREFWEKFKYYV